MERSFYRYRREKVNKQDGFEATAIGVELYILMSTFQKILFIIDSVRKC